MDPKATTPIPNPLGTRFVATWPEDCSGWQVTRHAPGEDGQPPMGAEEYAASLPKPWSSPAVTSFLSCPGRGRASDSMGRAAGCFTLGADTHQGAP